MKHRCHSIRIVLWLFVFTVLFALSSCHTGRDADFYSPSTLVSLAYSCGSPVEKECYSFSIRESGSDVIFTAWCFGENGDEIRLTGEKVPADAMKELRELDEKYDISGFLTAYQQTEHEDISYSPDATYYSLTASWSDGSELSAPTAWLAEEDLQHFFYSLAEQTNSIKQSR